jgi:alpha-1,6-mannosyltransferase
LDIFPYIELGLDTARQIAAVVGVAFATYLVLLDPRTKTLFTGSRSPDEAPLSR